LKKTIQDKKERNFLKRKVKLNGKEIWMIGEKYE